MRETLHALALAVEAGIGLCNGSVGLVGAFLPAEVHFGIAALVHVRRAARRGKAGAPEDVSFQTKPEIALAQIAQAVADGVPEGAVLMGAGYGVSTALRMALGLSYAAGIPPQTSVWKEGGGLLPPKFL